MPLYEYRCVSCGERFEVLQRMGAGAEGVSCPSCGAGGVERVHSTFASAVGSAAAPCGAPSRAACGTGGFT
ncbi:MAG: zinc ribbon domain-containing protein [Acidobacteriota bacterium]|jgi:putative FmdB family regulatory protein